MNLGSIKRICVTFCVNHVFAGTHSFQLKQLLLRSVGNEIRDGTWIGARATIMKQISIGDGCAVAARACVGLDIPEHTLVGGVPARLIREFAP